MKKNIQRTYRGKPNEVKSPENFWQAILQVVWGWSPRWRLVILSILGVLTISFLIWNTLPEKSKTEIIESTINRKPKESQTTNSNGSSTISTDRVRITFQLPKESEPVELYIHGGSGSVSLSFIITPGSNHSIDLPPGNYEYIVKDASQHAFPAPPYMVKSFTVEKGEPVLIQLPPFSLFSR